MRFYALAQRPWIEVTVEREVVGGYWGLLPGILGSVDLAPLGAHDRLFVTSDAPLTGEHIVETFGDGSDRLDRYQLSAREQSAWERIVGPKGGSLWTLLDLFRSTLTDQADPEGFERAKPIMPTSRGVLELHLGGHSRIWAEKLPDDPTTHPAWARIQAVKQRDYREIQAHDPLVARKWLGNEQQRFRLSPEAARDLIIPSDLPRELPLRPTTTITDNFNRADQTGLGSSAEGWSWVGVTVTWDIVSNTTYGRNSSSSTTQRADSALSSDDNYSQADSFYSTNQWALAGVVARLHASANTGYVFCHSGGSLGSNVEYEVYKAVAGTYTLLTAHSFVGNHSYPHTAKLEVNGSTLSGYRDGVLGPDFTDTAISSGLYTGLSGRNDSRHDNFEGADLLAGGITGTLDVTLANITASAAGELTLEGTLAATVDAVAVTSVGVLVLEGTLSQTLGAVTLEGLGGDSDLIGTLAVTLDAVALAGEGALALDATLTGTLEDVVLAAASELALDGALSVTLGAVTLDAAGVGVILTEGVLDVELGDVTLASASALSLQALLARTVDAILLDSATELAIRGEVETTLPGVTIEAFGAESAAIVGALSVSIGDIFPRIYGSLYDYDAIRNKPFNRKLPRLFLRPWRIGW